MGLAERGALCSPGSISPTETMVNRKIRYPARIIRLLAGMLTVLALSSSVASAEGFGPFPVRNFQPFQQLVLNLPGDRASVLKQGTLDVRLELAETASIFNEHEPQASAVVKFETLRSGLFLRYGVTEKLELGVEIPVYYRYQGFMNGAITATERATTGEAPARAALKNTNFAFNVTHNGQTIMGGGSGATGLGDTTLMSKLQLLTESGWTPTVSLRGAVKLPTGDEPAFFGSGSPDFGAGLAVEKHLASRWILYSNLNGVLPTGSVAGFPMQPTFTAIVAVEYLWSENLSLTAHFDYYSSPFHNTALSTLDKGVTESVAGFSYRVAPHLLWQFYAVENLDFITGSAADFTISTLLTYRFESSANR
jgi:uncharacterized protein DUF3187